MDEEDVEDEDEDEDVDEEEDRPRDEDEADDEDAEEPKAPTDTGQLTVKTLQESVFKNSDFTCPSISFSKRKLGKILLQ